MPNTLGLEGDGDEVDFVRDVERAFGIELPNEDLNRCTTVGDVHDLVRAQGVAVDRSAPCGTSAVFYTLRRAFDPETRGGLKTDTSLDSLGFKTPRDLYRHLARETGLRLPAIDFTMVGTVASFALIFGISGIIAAVLNGDWRAGLVAALACSAAWAGMRLDPCCLPKGVITVGDLARRTAALNAPRLRETGRRAPDSWDIVAGVAVEYGVVAPSEIGRDTHLIVEPQPD